MSEFWIPPATQPQVSEQARLRLTEKFLEAGVVRPAVNAFYEMSETEELLGNYALELGAMMGEVGSQIKWHKNVLKIGAGIAYASYRESGYKNRIDENFAIAELMAEIEGVPESYIFSLSDDQNLISVIDTSLSEGTNMVLQRPELRHVLNVGAGLVRYYFEQAIVLA